jgi:hypothetical protein
VPRGNRCTLIPETLYVKCHARGAPDSAIREIKVDVSLFQAREQRCYQPYIGPLTTNDELSTMSINNFDLIFVNRSRASLRNPTLLS